MSLRAEVEGLASYPEMAAKWLRRRDSGGGVRMTASVSPALYRLAQTVRDVLRIPRVVEIEVSAGAEGLIEVAPGDEDRPITVRMSSASVTDCSLREALFAVGRRVGGVLMEQMRIPADPLAGQMSPDRPTLLVGGLYRFQELACDRVGLLACQDLTVAVRSILRISSGLPAALLAISFDELLRESIDEEEAMISPVEHDFVLLRIAALRKFAECPKYQDFLSEETIDADAIEAAAGPVATSRTAEVKATIETIPMARVPEVSKAVAPPEMCVEYRSIGGDPSVVEQVIRFATAEVKSPARELTAPLEEPFSRREFCVPAAVWLIGREGSMCERLRQVLEDLYGEEVMNDVRTFSGGDGEAALRAICREKAKGISSQERSIRVDMLRELCRVTMIDEKDPTPFLSTLCEISELLGLSVDDVSMTLAEYIDPEYANYRFQTAETVEVQLDGQWMEGRIERVDPGGELSVRFAATGKVLRLHPTADLIRPGSRRRVG